MTDHTPHQPPRRELDEAGLVEFVRSLDERAPDQLHRRVQALIDTRTSRNRPRRGRPAAAHLPRLGWRLGGAVAVLAAGLALLLGLPDSGSTPFSLRQASALTLAPADLVAPREDPRHPGQLARGVDGVAFPYWEDSVGWRSTGARVGRIDGRSVTTVFYADARGRRIGYAIVGGTPAPRVSGGRVSWKSGTAYRLTRERGAELVAWDRDGHLCVISGHRVSGAALLALARADGS